MLRLENIKPLQPFTQCFPQRKLFRDSVQALQAPVQSGLAEWGSGLARAALGPVLAVSLSSVPAVPCTLTHMSMQQPDTACAWPPGCLQSPWAPPSQSWLSQWCLFSWFKVPVSSRGFPRSSCRKAAWFQALTLPCD